MSQWTMERPAVGRTGGAVRAVPTPRLSPAVPPDEARRALAATRRLAVPEAIASSWDRSFRAGLRPETARGTVRAPRMHAGKLFSAVDTVARSREADLHRLGAALLVTDSEGLVLGRWTGDAELAQILEAAGICPGRDISEGSLGTSSVITLLCREPVYVEGAQHFADVLAGVATAGVAVLHPVTRRVLGSLHVVLSAAHSSPAVLAWLNELVREVDRRMLSASADRDRILMDRFLEENRDSRHAVVAVNERTILTNAAAARLVGVEEQAVLWEQALAVMNGEEHEDAIIEVGRGTSLRVVCTKVTDARGRPAGVLLRLKRARIERSGQPASELPGLAGSGDVWRAMTRRIAANGTLPLLLVGERGTGKAAIGRALARGVLEVVDLRAPVLPDGADIPRALAAAVDRLSAGASDHSSPIPTLLLRGLEATPSSVQEDIAAILDQSPADVRLIGTSTAWPGSGGAVDLVGSRFPAHVPVPSLRERTEDIPELVRAFTKDYADEVQRQGSQWMTDALQALTRLDWPDNVRGLRDLVRVVQARVTAPYITVHDLPAATRSQTSRRSLAGLEQAEARAIMLALEDAEGNKCRAAETLGIARSTLYRKMRSLGLDLSASAF